MSRLDFIFSVQLILILVSEHISTAEFFQNYDNDATNQKYIEYYCRQNTNNIYIPHLTDCNKLIKCGRNNEDNLILTCNHPYLYNDKTLGE